MTMLERVLPFVHFEVADRAPTERNEFATWWFPIDDILDGHSGDGGGPESCDCTALQQRHTYWDCVLLDKRSDWGYRDLRAGIMADGFRDAARVTDDWGTWRFADGHHRLAIAIELGYTHIPVDGRRLY